MLIVCSSQGFVFVKTCRLFIELLRAFLCVPIQNCLCACILKHLGELPWKNGNDSQRLPGPFKVRCGATVLCATCTLKKPKSSIWFHGASQHTPEPPPQREIGRHRLQKRFLWLGHFGHRFWKPTLLVGIFPGLRARRELSSRRPPPRIAKAWHKWKDAQGRVRCAGTMNLKATEHYPARFCHCMVRLVSEVVRSPCTIPHGLGKLSKPVATVD